MHGKEFPCLDICGFYLLLGPGYYMCRGSDDRQGIGVDLVLIIQLTSQDLF